MFSGELEILQYLASVRTDFLNHVFEFITFFGEGTLLILFLAVLYFAIDKQLARKITFLTLTSLSLNGILKNLVALPRPFASGAVTCVRPETATGYAFPSGHTQTVATWSFGLAKSLKKPILWIFAILITLAVGFSRMYLGAHFPSDVVVGALLGALVPILLDNLYERYSARLHVTVLIASSPFYLYFLFNPDPYFEDFFKIFGMLGGFCLSDWFASHFETTEDTISVVKRILRIVLAIAVLLAVNFGLSVIFPGGLLWDARSYFLLVFLALGALPVFFEKIKL